MQEAKIYKDADINLEILKDIVVGVIGYGSQGRSQAQNLRDSNIHVIIGARKDGASWQTAESDGFKVCSVSEAAKTADYIQLLLPDPIQPQVYTQHIAEHLTEGKILGFSHGFNIHYKQISPPEFVDVVMVAPKGPGYLLRKFYLDGFGIPGLVAVAQDHSKKAKEYAMAYAKAIGCARVGIIETTFQEETETDLFGEQAVLCGGVSELIRAGFDTLVEAGYQPEVAYFECCHELKLIVDLIWERGISGMRQQISDTAEYGDLTRGKFIIDKHVRRKMKDLLENIRNGSFAKEWLLEDKTNRVVYHSIRAQDKAHLIEEVGSRLRQLMGIEKK